MKIKIYLTIIALLSGFLIYAIFFMKSDYIDTTKLPKTIAQDKVTPGDERIISVKPDFLPKPIPKDVLRGAEENDFYWNLFLNKNRKGIVYSYKYGSKDPKNSEEFHKQLEDYLTKILYNGMYKNLYLTESGTKTYEKRILVNVEAANYKPVEGDTQKHIDLMGEKKARIDAVKAFRAECAKTMCIINNKTQEYVVIDKRDIETAKKTLRDYKAW